jgi:hypothetical protein
LLSFRIKKKISELLAEDEPLPILPFHLESAEFSHANDETASASSSKQQVRQNNPGSSQATAPAGTRKEEDNVPKSFKSIKTVSLRKKEVTAQVVHQNEEKAELAHLSLPFTKEALLQAWAILVESIQEDTHLFNAMKAYPPELLDNDQIEVVVQNQPLEKKILDLKPSLERKLQLLLKNNRIQMRVRIAEIHENLRPYTAKDKLDCMIQKNPNLEFMYRTLGLEL